MVIAYGPTLWVLSLALWGVAGKAHGPAWLPKWGH
jgi:hypothetical protein